MTWICDQHMKVVDHIELSWMLLLEQLLMDRFRVTRLEAVRRAMFREP